jgi:hypothetical protein
MTANAMVFSRILTPPGQIDCPPSQPPGKRYEQLKALIHEYFCTEYLNRRLTDLPRQLQHPHTRPWQRIRWSDINVSQIVGIDPLLFIAIVAGAADTEAPIRGYTATSRQYLAPLYPAMARYVGGTVDAQGQLLELGLWEREERRHTPALQKLYTQLTGLNLTLVGHSPRPYQATAHPSADLYRHGLHRIATEYGAACLYLWLMAHTTGTLQTVLTELLVDEINHMVKFWGFGRWAFPKSTLLTLSQTVLGSAWEKLCQQNKQNSLLHTLQRMAQVLHWDAWSFQNKATFGFTLVLVLHYLRCWNRSFTSDDLQTLLGKPLEALPPS